MNFVKHLKHTAVSYFFFLKRIVFPSSLKNPREIPILINNFNRLSTLKKLIRSLEVRGYNAIYIIDNNSTYAPLLEYYDSCRYTVFRLKENLGFKALWKSDLKERFCKDYYIYTDSDVVPADDCPDDFVEYFFHQLQKYPLARKIGFSLRIDNLPDHFKNKKDVIKAETNNYKRQNTNGLYRAPIDTTFALYRPHVGLSRSRYVEAYRTPYPYQAEHLPWYNDSGNLSEEELYYIQSCTQKTEWTFREKTVTE